MLNKTFLSLIVVVLILAGCAREARAPEGQMDGMQSEVVMETESPLLEMGEFDVKAGDYVDKTVKVTGIVDHLCKHGAKRMKLATDDGDVHVDADERFDESLAGSEITVTGIVREFKVDEAHCLKMEEDNIMSHKNGEIDKGTMEARLRQAEFYRDSMQQAGTDHISFYSLDYVSHVEL